MASGMSGHTSCLTSRWDKPGPTADLPGFLGQSSPSVVTMASYTTPSTPSNSRPAEEEKPGGVELAAAMAAKINAMLMAKGKLKTPPPLHTKVVSSAVVSSTVDELVVTEVDINDVPINCRNLLTKGKTQEEIRQYTGAVVSTKGYYMTEAEKGQVKGGDRPLYLHVQGKTQDEVSKAVMRIKEIISEDLLRSSIGSTRPIIPMVTVYPQPPKSAAAPQQPPVPALSSPHLPTQQPLGPGVPQGVRAATPFNGYSGNSVHTKIFVGLDHAPPSFSVKDKVEGPSSSYLHHIQTETGARVFLRGKGSGYMEQASRRESFEPLYLYISHQNSSGLEAAKKLCESLLETVRAEYARVVSSYPAAGTAQAYPSHGYPSNSNYINHPSWYSYPSGGYTCGYPAYPGSTDYWSSANAHANVSTTTQSSQAMVQYPVCPRKPPPYLAQDTGVDYSTAPDCTWSDAPQGNSPKQHFLESSEDVCQNGTDSAAETDKPCHSPPAFSYGGQDSERILMPPPPVPPGVGSRKRARECEDHPSEPAVRGVEEEQVKKPKPQEPASGLVPYGGDSSDEEEERSRSSKKSL